MKFGSFLHGGRTAYGIVDEDGVRPVAGQLLDAYPDLRSAIAGNALAEIAAHAQANERLDDFAWLPVVSNPGKIFCIGMNYLAHIKEMGRERPAYPTLFVRYIDSLVGHGNPIVRPTASTHLDFEGELAFVIGKQARHVAAVDALDYIAGYTCFLDGSVRDYQRHTSQFIAGKNFRHSGAFGPWLVTSDEIDNPGELSLETRVNGESMQTGRIDDLCFGIGALIEYLSTICQLEPGDVVATGTPSGVGAARDPQVWLQPGDTVEVEISRIGILRNVVVDE